MPRLKLRGMVPSRLAVLGMTAVGAVSRTLLSPEYKLTDAKRGCSGVGLCDWSPGYRSFVGGPTTVRNCLTPRRILGDNPG
jgi:hypothetical protein